MRRRDLGLGALALAIVLAGGGWQLLRATAPGPVSEAEARAYFNRIVAAARAGDLDRLCALNGAVNNCQVTLDIVGREIPQTPPRVTRAKYIEKQSSDDTPGMLLVVEGTGADGKPYATDVFIFREDRNTLKATNAVYWSDYKVPLDDVIQPYPTSGAN